MQRSGSHYKCDTKRHLCLVPAVSDGTELLLTGLTTVLMCISPGRQRNSKCPSYLRIFRLQGIYLGTQGARRFGGASRGIKQGTISIRIYLEFMGPRTAWKLNSEKVCIGILRIFIYGGRFCISILRILIRDQGAQTPFGVKGYERTGSYA